MSNPVHILENNAARALRLLGFGEYSLPQGQTFEGFIQAKKTHALVMGALFGFIGAALPVIIIVVFALTPYLTPIAIVPLAIAGVYVSLTYKGLNRCAPPTNNLGLNAENWGTTPLGTFDERNYSGIVCQDNVESTQFKMELIRAAQHHIFICGYLGGDTLDRALDLAEMRMRENGQLKMEMITSDFFISSSNRQKIEQMKREFGGRFDPMITPEWVFYCNPLDNSWKLATRHVKSMVIDYGAYACIGGSALYPKWSDVIGDMGLKKPRERKLINIVSPEGLRDMDFIIHSPEANGLGRTLFLEMQKLRICWKYHSVRDLDVLGREARRAMEEIPEQIDTRVTAVDNHHTHTDHLRLKMIASGPEQSDNPFLHELIHLVQNARQSIVIDNMYFHPPQELLQALIDASNRGVQITLITNTISKKSPGTHSLWMDMARYNYAKLFEGRIKPHVKIYEYNQKRITLHKKVAVIDSSITVFGSSNFGDRSIGRKAYDHELNMVVESSAFAEKTLVSLRRDQELSAAIPDDRAPTMSLRTRILAPLQRLISVPIL